LRVLQAYASEVRAILELLRAAERPLAPGRPGQRISRMGARERPGDVAEHFARELRRSSRGSLHASPALLVGGEDARDDAVAAGPASHEQAPLRLVLGPRAPLHALRPASGLGHLRPPGWPQRLPVLPRPVLRRQGRFERPAGVRMAEG